MIASLRGKVIRYEVTRLLLDVGGVGFAVNVPSNTFSSQPAEGEEVFVYTHLAISDDARNLYGFGTVGEKEVFLLLIKTKGVGPRIALMMLSAMGTDGLVDALSRRDDAALTRIPGVGKRLAERILAEVGSQVEGLRAVAPSPAGRAVSEAENALVHLGYSARDAAALVRGVLEKNADASDGEALVRAALQSLGGKR